MLFLLSETCQALHFKLRFRWHGLIDAACSGIDYSGSQRDWLRRSLYVGSWRGGGDGTLVWSAVLEVEAVGTAASIVDEAFKHAWAVVGAIVVVKEVAL